MGTPVKHGGAVSDGCVTYQIIGISGSFTPTSTAATTTASSTPTTVSTITCYDDTYGSSFDGAAAIDYVAEFCGGLPTTPAYYYDDIALENGEDTVTFDATVVCDNSLDFDACESVLSNLINQCKFSCSP